MAIKGTPETASANGLRSLYPPDQKSGHESIANPIFTDPREYLRFRHKGLFGYLKHWFEWRALDRCLSGRRDLDSICDCPCGPGRLFHYWKRRFRHVDAVDLSDSMVDAASELHGRLGLSGSVQKADAFALRGALETPSDLVASIRFFYYFERPQRVDLLRSLSMASRKYVLVMYKTTATWRGRRNHARTQSSNHALPKKFCSYDEILSEVVEAGLQCLRIQPIGETADRVYVLACKAGQREEQQRRPLIDRTTPERKMARILAAAAVLLFASMMSSHVRAIVDPDEHAIEDVVRECQDGNDRFYVSVSPDLEDLDTDRTLSFMTSAADVASVLERDRREAKDSFFIVSQKHLERIQASTVWRHLCMWKTVELSDERYFLLSTERKESHVGNEAGAVRRWI